MTARLLIFICVLLIGCRYGFAQSNSNRVFDDLLQPGTILNQEIIKIAGKGYSNRQAINFTINQSIADDASTLPTDLKTLLSNNLSLAEMFFFELMETQSLINSVKVLTESYPDKIEQVISLATALYPDYTQQVFYGVLITGLLPSEDIKSIFEMSDELIQPVNFTQIPASSTRILPLGTGVGSGGTGAGDITVSTN